MTISHRRLRAGLEALGSAPSPTPDAAFVSRLDLHLRQVDLDELVVAIEPAPSGRAAIKAPSRTIGRTGWSTARVGGGGRRTPLRVALAAIGATFATAATAAAFVIAQPASRVKVEDPAERPTIAVTTAAVATTIATTTTDAPSGAGPAGSTAPLLIAPPVTTTELPIAATTTPPAQTTTEVRRATTVVTVAPTTRPTEPPHPTTTDSPGAPVTISLTCTGRHVGSTRSVLCEWSAADGAANYRVLRGDGRLLVPVQGTLRYEDLAVTGDVTYTYLAQAVGPDGVTIVANSNRASVACCLPA
jgi:hypothetical protein